MSDSFGDDNQWARAHFLFELFLSRSEHENGDRPGACAAGMGERVTASSGLEVVELEFRGGGKARMLRVYIDKPGGVTHADCEAVSREVGTILDVEDGCRAVVHAGGFLAGAGP